MKMIVENVATEYKDEGSGKALLLLHGWGNDLHTWDKIAPALAQKYRVVRLDLPGFGQSEMPKSAWHVEEYAEFVKAFINKAGILPVAIVGHSLGGRVAIKGVSENILVPEKMVLIASAGNARRRTVRNHSITVLSKVAKALTALLPRPMQEQLRAKLYEQAGSDYLAAGEMRDIFLNVIREDLSQSAGKISIPTLLIWGRDDRTTPVEDGERFHGAIRGSELEIVEGAGHFVHAEKPEEVAAMIEHFV
jgi:pimeloyl-ACP methyl ester carboxylesterase